MPQVHRSVSLADDRLIRELVELVTKLELDCRDFVVFGSGPLLAHGLRTHLRDVDVVARGAVWQRVQDCGAPAVGDLNGAPMALFCDGLIQFSPGWISPEWDADQLIDNAEMIEGLPFARLADVLRYKQALDRPKDRADIAALNRWLNPGASPAAPGLISEPGAG
ncbi:hypothetical protein [Actinoplanes sp. TFC3]|uniref:hypothetical protein n=1 Tax=Actinoplanes sp. TFC3 TaxID=1710355 RepID=UPI000829AC95|nr:hypothetical protein [Actinoplanes sp. TFC3]